MAINKFFRAVAEERQGGYSAKEIVRLNLIVCDDSVLDPQAGLREFCLQVTPFIHSICCPLRKAKGINVLIEKVEKMKEICVLMARQLVELYEVECDVVV